MHSYERGWQDGEIYGTVVPGFFEWLVRARDHFTIAIYSSRSKSEAGRVAMIDWLIARYSDWFTAQPKSFLPPPLLDILVVTHEKPPAFLTIDDRAIRFDGDWSAPELQPDAMLAYKPWTNR